MWSLRRQDGGDTDAGMEVLLEQVAEQQRIQRDYDDEIAGGSSFGGIGGLMANMRDTFIGDEFAAGSLRAGMANSPVVPPDIGDIEGMLAGEERAFDIPIEAEIGMAVIPGGGKGKGIGGITDLFKSMGKSLDPEDGRTLDKMSNQENRSTEMPKIREMLNKPPSFKLSPDLIKQLRQGMKDTYSNETHMSRGRSDYTASQKREDLLNKGIKYIEEAKNPREAKSRMLDYFGEDVSDYVDIDDLTPPLTKPGRRQPPTSDPSDKLRHQRASLKGQLEQDKKLTQETRQRMGGELRKINRQLRDMGIDPDLMAAGGSLMYKKGYYGKSYK